MTKSEAGHGACSAFLEALDDAAHKLKLEPASRQYRVSFMANYRELFGAEEGRNYKVEVLEASIAQHDVTMTSYGVTPTSYDDHDEAGTQ